MVSSKDSKVTRIGERWKSEILIGSNPLQCLIVIHAPFPCYLSTVSIFPTVVASRSAKDSRQDSG